MQILLIEQRGLFGSTPMRLDSDMPMPAHPIPSRYRRFTSWCPARMLLSTL
jgi:hypothetical protein